MKRSDFYYDLPDSLIAQTPLEPRDSSRLMKIVRSTGRIEHTVFHNILDYLHPGDLLIVNDSRVIPARLYGIKEGTGAAIEFCCWNKKRMIGGKSSANRPKRPNQEAVLCLETVCCVRKF